MNESKCTCGTVNTQTGEFLEGRLKNGELVYTKPPWYKRLWNEWFPKIHVEYIGTTFLPTTYNGKPVGNIQVSVLREFDYRGTRRLYTTYKGEVVRFCPMAWEKDKIFIMI